MKSLFIFALIFSLIPIQVLSQPAPIALTTLVFPVSLLFLGLKLSNWAVTAILVLTYGLASALIHGIFISSAFPLFSFLSFGSPLVAIFLGLNDTKRYSEVPLFLRHFWVVSLLLSGALIVNLVTNGFVARTSIQTVSDYSGYYSASIVAGSIYGAKMFASFGINSFAGILISMFFLCILCIPRAGRYVRVALVFSSIVILLFGFLLNSRMFLLGFSIFMLVLVMRSGLPPRVRLLLLVIGVASISVVISFDPRIAASVEFLFQERVTTADLAGLTSNRSVIWQSIGEGPNLILGNAFGSIRGPEHASSSFHLYAVTILAKGGLFFALPVFYLITQSLWLPVTGKTSSKLENVIINAALWSFVAQSFVWDIFAVQVYGHIAWFFVGLSLARTKRPGI